MSALKLKKRISLRGLLVLAVLAIPPAVRGQVGPVPNNGPLGSIGLFNTVQKWHVFGQVKTVDGKPVGEAKVKVDIGYARGCQVGDAGFCGQTREQGIREVDTDLQGNFSTDYDLNAQYYPSLSVTLTVTKPEFQDAREVVDFGTSDKTWAINLTLRQKGSPEDALSQEDLLQYMGARLQGPARLQAIPAQVRKDYGQALDTLFARQDAASALRVLARVAQRERDCEDCLLADGLAELVAGSWNRATQQFGEAGKRNESAAVKIPEPLLALGVLEEWRKEPLKAASFFAEGLKIAPDDPLLLQELGRSQLLKQNWEAAEDYLSKAEAAGAPGARLLRVQALLGEGDVVAANDEMQKFLAGKELRDQPMEVRRLAADVTAHVQLEGYGKVQSVVAQPLDELIKADPELAGLEPAQDPSQLVAILKNTGERVEAFFRSFPNTVSVEGVRQEQLRKGKVKDVSTQTYRYLLLAEPEKQGLGLEEYRTDTKGSIASLGGNGGFMITTGFASTELLFHPAYQPGASFRYLGQQVVDGRRALVVAFAQNPATSRMMERFNTQDASVLILLQGLAWISPDTYQILRLRTDLLKPQSAVRLGRQTTEVEFQSVQFKGLASELWLPHEVTVTVEWKGKTFRNVHEYTDFHLFNVQTEEKRKTV